MMTVLLWDSLFLYTVFINIKLICQNALIWVGYLNPSLEND